MIDERFASASGRPMDSGFNFWLARAHRQAGSTNWPGADDPLRASGHSDDIRHRCTDGIRPWKALMNAAEINRHIAWVMWVLWLIAVPALTGILLWNLLVSRPNDQLVLAERQRLLIEDNKLMFRNEDILIHNQQQICKALKVDCWELIHPVK